MNSFFPSPLSAFEYYLFLDSRPSYPLDFFVHVHVDGSIDPSTIAAGFRLALNQHTLLNASVRRNGKRCVWVAAPQAPKVHFVERHTVGKTVPKTPIDIEHNAGVRCTVIRDVREAEFVFQFHHAATDGLGALGFITDVLLFCGRKSEPQLPEPKRLEERLSERYWSGYYTGSLWNRVYKSITGMLRTREFLGAKICPLLSHRPDVAQPRSDTDYPRYLSCNLTKTETETLKKAAIDSDVSLNTLVVGIAFQSFDEVRKASPGYDATEFIRIAIPGNLRYTRGNEELPAANFFSMTFPARNTRQIASQTFMQSLHQEIRAARENYFFATFSLMLKVLGLLPGVMHRIVNVKKCQATTLLTNLGTALYEFPRLNRDAVITVGDFSVQRLELVPPMRPFQTFAISTLEYAGRQTVTMSYDPRIHDDSEASSMFNAYLARLRDAGSCQNNQGLSVQDQRQ